jgi:methyl-accepting chemotaxis protein
MTETQSPAVAAVDQVLAVASSQIGATAKQVEEAVATVCRSFAGIVRRTKEAAAQATTGGQDGGALDTARRTISDLMGRMDGVRKAADEAVNTLKQIEQIGQRVDRIQESLSGVDQVAHMLHILAMNARIEAVRAGDRGRTFAVVASETQTLATNIRATAIAIREMVTGLWQEVRDSTRRMRSGLIDDRSDDLSRATELSREEGTQALDALGRAHADMQRTVAAAADNAARVAADVAQAITALQFQDAVNQQLEHVREALADARGCLASGDPAAADALLDRLQGRLTMESEREHLRGRATAPAPAAGGSVELF